MPRDTSEIGLNGGHTAGRRIEGMSWFPVVDDPAKPRPENPEHEPPVVDINREERFMNLFLTHERRIHAFILALVPNWTDADDLLQETSTVMWRRLDQFQPGTNFLAWAQSIARYQVLNFRRKKRRELVVFSDETVERLASTMISAALRPDERRDALVSCLPKLAERDRELIQLRYQAGATLRGVADRAGRSLQAVYKSLNRIHGQLLVCIRRTLAAGSTPS